MHDAELLLLALMAAVGGLSVMARMVGVPYPIVLVLEGLVLGFVPGIRAADLPPDLVLVLFLPPLLYWSAFFSSPRDLRSDARVISLLAVGLVLVTAGAVAAFAHTTLVVQGLTLPSLIRRLGVMQDDGAEEQEELRGRLRATDAALARLEELATADWTRDDTVQRMRGLYEFRRRRLKARAGFVVDDGYQDRSLAYQRLVRELLEAQRRAIVRLRNQGAISNDAMHRIERDLDLEDSRLEI